MLTKAERERIAREFSVYEHEWRFFAGFMGEPFLIGNYLVYWDGPTANVCAFPLGGRTALVDTNTLEKILKMLPTVDPIQLVHVWGQIELGTSLMVEGRRLSLVDVETARHAYPGEHTIDLKALATGRQREAAKAIRSVHNKGIVTCVRELERFEGNHFRLVETWRRTRPIDPIAACAVSTLPSYCREAGVVVLEARRAGRICGFAVLARPVPSRAILMLSFSEQFVGARIEDSLMYAAIEYCGRHGLDFLHCGYAGTLSLARFKEKWGAHPTGPSYRQALFAADEIWRERAIRREFYWAMRLLTQGEDASWSNDPGRWPLDDHSRLP